MRHGVQTYLQTYALRHPNLLTLSFQLHTPCSRYRGTLGRAAHRYRPQHACRMIPPSAYLFLLTLSKHLLWLRDHDLQSKCFEQWTHSSPYATASTNHYSHAFSHGRLCTSFADCTTDIVKSTVNGLVASFGTSEQSQQASRCHDNDYFSPLRNRCRCWSHVIEHY